MTLNDNNTKIGVNLSELENVPSFLTNFIFFQLLSYYYNTSVGAR